MQQYTLLGQRVAKKDRQLAQLSCVAPEIRQFIGYIDCYNALNKSNEYQLEREALIKLGRASWPRKELTDLALRVGDPTKHLSFLESLDDEDE